MVNLNELSRSIKDYPSPATAVDALPRDIQVLGVGSARLVIENPNDPGTVVKIGVGIGVNQNQSEIAVWNKATQTAASEYLLPIIDYGANGQWIKTPRLTRVVDGLDKYVGPDAEFIADSLREHGINLYEVETGIYDGKPVAVDYGLRKDDVQVAIQ